jgi:16S rRNA (cytosine967-C5)-methyltransferase
VHHAVARTRSWLSAGESRVANAVLRRVPEILHVEISRDGRDADSLALRRSHPVWLVERWLAHWGADIVERLLAWDQQPAPVYARIIGAIALPPGFESTPWPGFCRLDRPDWADVERLLAAGAIYLQDPATAVAPGLLAVQAGESVLDVCAAPGGKTLLLAEDAGPTGRVVAVDLPGPRLDRLQENLARYSGVQVEVLGLDARELTPERLADFGLPGLWDAVLIDAPCSNTGVLRHRVDAKWRLQAGDLEALPELQFALLTRAASVVRPGGRLVYSTCSIEPEENEAVVQRLRDEAGAAFSLEQAITSFPWETGHDGAGAFLLRRSDDAVGDLQLSSRLG